MKLTKETLIRNIKNPTSSLQTALFVVLTAAMYLYRAHPYFFKPQLFAEDGVLWLSEGQFKGAKVLLLKPYNGFFHFPERLFGFLVSRVSLYWAPAIFACTAWALFVGVAYYLFSKRTKLLTTNFERIFMALSLCLIANMNEFFFNFSNSIFLLGIIGALIIIAKRSKNIIIDIIEKVIYVLACMCLPFAWFYLPITLIDRYKYKTKNGFFLVVALVTSVAQAIGYFLTNTYRSPVTLFSLVSQYVVLEFYNQILIPALRFARVDIPLEAYSHSHYLIALASLSVIATALATFVVLKRSNKQVFFLLLFLAGMTFASFKSPTVRVDTATNVFKIMATVTGGNRYFIYGIIAINLIFVKCIQAILIPKARYTFMTLFIIFGLLTSIHYKAFYVDKGWQDFSQEYRRGVTLHKAGQKAVIIPVNPAPWTMGLFR